MSSSRNLKLFQTSEFIWWLWISRVLTGHAIGDVSLMLSPLVPARLSSQIRHADDAADFSMRGVFGPQAPDQVPCFVGEVVALGQLGAFLQHIVKAAGAQANRTNHNVVVGG